MVENYTKEPVKYTIFLGDAEQKIECLKDDSISLIVTSPPYYNARDYVQYSSFDDYIDKMTKIFKKAYTKLKNYHMCVINVSDVIGCMGKSKSTKQKIPIVANFIIFMQKIGFRFHDDIIWDKGEVQSKRNFVGGNYPYQKYPINCYEHILVFQKIDNNVKKPSCPLCNGDKSVVNGIVNGIITYECTNPKCTKSKSGRGKRFSEFQNIKKHYQTDKNKISDDVIKKWRKDIVRITPVIKINSKGSNKLGHTAPFPMDIPKWAISYYSGVGDLVLDCFSGSGTTGLACRELNRDFVGIELNKDYYELSKNRIEQVV